MGHSAANVLFILSEREKKVLIEKLFFYCQYLESLEIVNEMCVHYFLTILKLFRSGTQKVLILKIQKIFF